MLMPSPPGHRHSTVTESIVLPPDPEGSISSKINEWLSSAGLEAQNKFTRAFYKSEDMSGDRCMERDFAVPELLQKGHGQPISSRSRREANRCVRHGWL